MARKGSQKSKKSAQRRSKNIAARKAKHRKSRSKRATAVARGGSEASAAQSPLTGMRNQLSRAGNRATSGSGGVWLWLGAGIVIATAILLAL